MYAASRKDRIYISNRLDNIQNMSQIRYEVV